MAFKYAVALTGSIATGKSTVAEIFKTFGFEVIDADRIAHEILDRHRDEVGRLFGQAVVTENGVDRKALGEIVFADKRRRKELEALLHPYIYAEIEHLAGIEDKKAIPYLVDIPLFFETNRYPIAKVLVVYTSEVLQCKRLMKRNQLSHQEAQKRIETQITIEQKKQKATYVIDNSQDYSHLQQECAKIKDVILGDFDDRD